MHSRKDVRLAYQIGINHKYEVWREPSGRHFLLVDGKERLSKLTDDGRKNTSKERVYNCELLLMEIQKLEDRKGAERV